MAFSGAFVKPFRPAFDAGLAAGNGLLNNLVAYWKLDEAAGANNALDAHTNGLTLAQSGSPGSATGNVYAGARSFASASAQHFSRASESLLQAGNIDLTVAIWIWSDITTYAVKYLLAKWSTAASREYAVFTSGDQKIRFGVSSTGSNSYQAIVTDSIPYQQWFLLVGWHDSIADTVNAQINNGTIFSAVNTAGIFSGTAILTISKQSNVAGAYWDGRIGPVALWKSAAGGGGALSASQRTALYNSGAGLAYSAFTI